MLEKISREDITKLRLMPGKEVAVLAFLDLEVGAIVRVTTASGNHYLYEVTNLAGHRAHVVRCDSRGPASSGYLGELCIVSPIFRTGDRVLFGRLNTSAVAGITILPKKEEVLS